VKAKLKKTNQPCEDVMKSEKKKIQERRRLDLAKIGINEDLTKKEEKKNRREEKRGEKTRVKKNKEIY
jgi:hypothetical protein